MQIRTRHLIKRGLQLRLTLAFVAFALVSALFQMVLTSRSFSVLAQLLPNDSGAFVDQLPKVLLTNLGLTLAWLLPTLIAAGILITHRVAGPAHRLETYLRSVLDGTETGPCRLRSKDELKELCELINQVTARLPLEVAEPFEELQQELQEELQEQPPAALPSPRGSHQRAEPECAPRGSSQAS